MPYRNAHYFLIVLFGLTVIAFWPRYFSALNEAPIAFHIHGITASLWIICLIVQSWSIHHGYRTYHRIIGKVSLYLFPPFLVGLLLVIQTLGRTMASGHNPVMNLYGAGLGAIDWLAFFTVCWLYFSGLRHRTNVQLHARFMLATPLLLLDAVFARLFEFYIPALTISGPENFSNFATATSMADIVALLITLGLYATNPKVGKPFLIVACVIVIQILSFHFLGPINWWEQFFIDSTNMPMTGYVVVGLVTGILVILSGWSRKYSTTK